MQLAINNMPTDSLEIEDFEFTPEQLKQMDQSMAARGIERWSLVAREKSTGNYVGWTDLTFNPTKPNLADVGGTAVAKDYQNLGLGRWLKAAVVEQLMWERPNVTKIRTANAHSNAPMLKINDELGFKPALTTDLWQVATEKVRVYIDTMTQ
jgi:mycothiol synthase